jgi:hypothetical protein
MTNRVFFYERRNKSKWNKEATKDKESTENRFKKKGRGRGMFFDPLNDRGKEC